MQDKYFIKTRTSIITKYRREFWLAMAIFSGAISGPSIGIMFIGSLRLFAWMLGYSLVDASSFLMVFAGILCLFTWTIFFPVICPSIAELGK